MLIEHMDTEQRAEVDRALGVADWPGPGQRVRPRAHMPTGAPAWWAGAEDASQSFLRAMGVD